MSEIMANPSHPVLRPWKDTTSHSRGDKMRVPRTFELDTGYGLRIIVTRSIYYPSESWVIRTYPELTHEREASSKDLEEAKTEAINQALTWMRFNTEALS